MDDEADVLHGQRLNGMSFTYWSWNPDSGDSGGIVSDDWNTVNQAKMNIVGPYLIPPTGGGGPTTTPPTTQPPTTAPPTGGACTATHTVTNQWPGSPAGFQASVMVKAGNAAISRWTVGWTFANSQTIIQLWSGTTATSARL